MNRICSEEKKAIITVDEVCTHLQQQNQIVAAKEKENAGFITTLLQYLSAMGMVCL